MKQPKLSHDQIAALCLELSLFFKAGADSGSALTLLAEETEDPALQQRLRHMAGEADGGVPLSQVFERSALFPREVWLMLRVGERTGRSQEALQGLFRYYDRRARTDRQTRSALLYPAILLLVMLAVIVVLLTQVFPIFSDVYASLGGQLTGLAGGLLRLGTLLRTVLPLLCVLWGLLAAFLLAFSLSQSLRERLLRLWQTLRGDRGLGRSQASARFALALSMGLSSGLTAEDATRTAGTLLEGTPGEDRLRLCLDALANGVSLVTALRAGELLPPAECRLLEIGLAGGSGELAAEEVARRLDLAAEDALEHTLSRVEPTMVVITSLLVGAILLSVMLPLANIMSAIG